VIGRLRRAAAALDGDQRLAGALALGLFVTMFLPWYSRSAVGVADGRPVSASDSLNAFQVFSFVEAAVLLVAVAVLVLLFARGEGRPFHLPGGDGTVVAVAGAWICVLVFFRQFDQPEPEAVRGVATSTGVSWGIFITFLVGAALAYSGLRLRGTPEPGPAGPRARPAAEPPTRLQETRVQETRVLDPAAEERERRRRERAARRDDPHRPVVDGGEQLSFDEQE
jgi:hypothetical protein